MGRSFMISPEGLPGFRNGMTLDFIHSWGTTSVVYTWLYRSEVVEDLALVSGV